MNGDGTKAVFSDFFEVLLIQCITYIAKQYMHVPGHLHSQIILTYVTLDHKTSHKIYASSESWINKLFVWFVRTIGQYLAEIFEYL